MDSLLQFAEELERRDEIAAAELGAVERLGREVERMRLEAEEVSAFLAALPASLAAVTEEMRAAEAVRVEAAGAVDAAEEDLRRAEERGHDDERLAAARMAQHAHDALREAELRTARAHGERVRLEAEADERRTRGATLEQEARGLAARLEALPRVAREAAVPPGPGLENVRAWAARARGGLLVAAAGIASERERVAREAAELLASVSGDPRALPGAAGVRARVAEALGRS
jgi:chromosome segregation ATPase